MEKIRLDPDIENWLIAFLSDELDENEELKVEAWIREGEENREAYESLTRDYLRVRWVQEYSHIKEEQAKRVIFSSLKKRKVLWSYYGVAASVVILFAISIFFITRENKHVPPAMVASVEVKPIQSQAILILSTGEEILLSKAGREILERDGSMLKVDSVAGIRYDSLSDASKTELIYNKIVVPRGGEYFVTLNDGTKVWLDAESELEYPVAFSGDVRDVKLKGEAYFSVTKNAEKPFIVQVGTYSLQVYGTEFNVNAYNPRQIETVLVSGSIGVRANAGVPEQMLVPNELSVSDSETGRNEVRQVDIYPYIAWKNQDIVFVNERLESIMERVARWYDVTVFFQNEDLKNLRFDCNMQRYADIKDLFFFLDKTSEARFSLNGRTVVVSKK